MLSASMRRELVARKTSSSVFGSSARWPSRPDTHHSSTITRPMPAPPSQTSPLRPSGRRNTQASSTNAIAVPSHGASAAGARPTAPPSSEGRSCPAGRVTNTRSTVSTRSTAVMPFIVANALRPSSSTTTSDFRLPPPTRTRLLLPQPDASTMPKPNISPPTTDDSHSTRGPPYRLLPASTQPMPTIALKPAVATAIASTHMRRRVKSPMLTMSASAPIVQKCVLCAIAPKASASAKADQSTRVVSEAGSGVVMRELSPPAVAPDIGGCE
jgi:hypothetical protein